MKYFQRSIIMSVLKSYRSEFGFKLERDPTSDNYTLFWRDSSFDPSEKDPACIQFMTVMKTRWEGYRREFGFETRQCQNILMLRWG